MNERTKRIRRIRIDDRGRSIVTAEWTRESGWTHPETDRVLARAEAGLARWREIGPGGSPWTPTGDEPLDAAALWGSPTRGGAFADGSMGLPGRRNVRFVR